MSKRLTRAEVPEHLTWNLTDIFVDDAAWETALASILEDLPSVTQYQGRLGEGPKVLFDCLEAMERYESARFLSS